MNTITMNGADLQWVRKALSSDKKNSIIRNLAVWLDEGTIAATDSHRIHSFGGLCPDRAPDYLIRPEDLKGFRKSGTVTFDGTKGNGTLTVYQVVKDETTKTIDVARADASYPILGKITQDAAEGTTAVIPSALFARVANAAVTAAALKSYCNPVTIDFKAGTIESATFDDVTVKATFAAHEATELNIQIAFHASRLADAMNLDGRMHTVQVRDGLKPALFSGLHRHVVLMPVRL